MQVAKPPIFQAGFSPILLTCKGNVGDQVIITISSDNVPDFSISSMLIKKEQTFNLAAYVQSLFDKSDTQAIANKQNVTDMQVVSYTLNVNGTPLGDKFYAMRSAAQVGDSADLSYKLGGFLTDMNRINVWEGYPAPTISVLAKSIYSSQLVENGKFKNKPLVDGLNNIEVSCGDSQLIIYKNAATWSDYYCRVEEITYFFTIHVGDRTAKLSGTVSLSVRKPDGNTYEKTAPYSGFQDVHFEIPIDETIVAASITANGELDTDSVQIIASLQPYRELNIPDATCKLPVNHSIFTQDSGAAISKNGSRLLNITFNQPITE